MIFASDQTLEYKLNILADAAKYDVACTSSGVERSGNKGNMGNTVAGGICHSFAADGRCISLLKILYTNECTFDCRYCQNRASNDIPRTSFTPDELCRLTMEFYRRNYIEGLFLSSGILVSPNYTMEQIILALKKLRTEYAFNGYIHCKAIPGASPELIEMAGWYADRMSINLELPTADGLRELAPHKTRKTILQPIRQIMDGISESQETLGMHGGGKGAYWHTQRRLENEGFHKNTSIQLPKGDSLPYESNSHLLSRTTTGSDGDIPTAASHTALSIQNGNIIPRKNKLRFISGFENERGFVPAGQSTQMIVGATGESDYQIVTVAEALYKKFDLKRVFYSAFVNINHDDSLPMVVDGPPLLREHRLYQADWLLRYYGFKAGELLSESRPNFNTLIDPKANWALGHLDIFPVEVNKADYFTLLRVPGIGMKSADRIVKARRSAKLRFEDLKKLGVVLKRALYFITCSGRMMYPIRINEDFITSQLVSVDKKAISGFLDNGISYRQLSLFDIGNGGIS